MIVYIKLAFGGRLQLLGISKIYLLRAANFLIRELKSFVC